MRESLKHKKKKHKTLYYNETNGLTYTNLNIQYSTFITHLSKSCPPSLVYSSIDDSPMGPMYVKRTHLIEALLKSLTDRKRYTKDHQA